MSYTQEISDEHFMQLRRLLQQNRQYREALRDGRLIDAEVAAKRHTERIVEFTQICDSYALHPVDVRAAFSEHMTKEEIEALPRWEYGENPATALPSE